MREGAERVCIDVGGTFTDCLVMDETGVLNKFKAPTTPRPLDRPDGRDQEGGARLRSFDQRVSRADRGAGARNHACYQYRAHRAGREGAITTKGFRDSIEIRRGIKPVDNSLYNLFIPPSRPLIPRARRLGVTERTLNDGSIFVPVDENEVAEAARKLKAQDMHTKGQLWRT